MSPPTSLSQLFHPDPTATAVGQFLVKKMATQHHHGCWQLLSKADHNGCFMLIFYELPLGRSGGGPWKGGGGGGMWRPAKGELE